MISQATLKIQRYMGRLLHKKPAKFPTGRKVISFTFDDFPSSALEIGGRILEEGNIRATYYASLGVAGKEGFPTQEQMLSVIKHGHEVGCHTFSHVNCGALSALKIKADLIKNQKTAQAVGGVKLENFSYPFGEFKLSTKKMAAKMFKSARTVEHGINRGIIDLSALRSIPIYEKAGITSIQPWIEKLKTTGGWIIFYTHDISEKPSDYGATEGLFAKTIELCREAGFEFMTVDEAANLCTPLD